MADRAAIRIERTGGGTVTVPLDNRTAVIRGIHAVTDRRIVVRGELGSRGDILTIIDVARGAIEDTIWGWYAAFSPDNRYVAYAFRIPPSSTHQKFSDALVVYDLHGSPDADTMVRAADFTGPEYRGWVIHPAKHRARRQYSVVPAPGDIQTSFLSPVAWSRDGLTVAVIEHDVGRGVGRLIAIGLADGIRKPRVRAAEIARTAFLDPRQKREDLANFPPFQSLQFDGDGGEVAATSYAMGPFEAKTVRIRVP